MKNLYILLLLLTIVSCRNNEEIGEPAKPSGTNENTVEEKILYQGTSVYGNFFIPGEQVGFSSLKENALAKEQLTILDANEDSQLKKSGVEGVQVLINGMDLSVEKRRLKSGQKNKNELLNSWYGQDISFVIKSKKLKNGSIEEDEKTIEMYMPDVVSITSPKIETEEELYPYCYYKDFKLSWTPDEKNENGLVVMVEWLGTVFGQDDTNKYVRNIDVLPNDNGTAILNDELFNGIPDKSVVYITLLRGNIAIADIEEYTYKLLGESHEVLPLILVRNIE